MGPKNIGYMGLEWIHMAQDIDPCQAVSKTVMHILFPRNAAEE
jgi:hypothetical protein